MLPAVDLSGSGGTASSGEKSQPWNGGIRRGGNATTLGWTTVPERPVAVLVAERLDGDYFLARGDLTPNHPVKRTARKDFVGPLGRHPRYVNMALGKTLLLGGLHPLGNPFFQFFDGIAANGKLDDVKRHVC